MKAVTGIFHDQEHAARAIEALGAAGVPTDEISVMVMDASGLHEVPVEETSPVLKGALAGGAIGAALGGIGAALAVTGVVVGPAGALLLGAGPVVAAIRGVLAGAGLGYGVGVLASLDHWKNEADLHAQDLEKGAALITIHSEELQDVARSILRESGAARISG